MIRIRPMRSVAPLTARQASRLAFLRRARYAVAALSFAALAGNADPYHARSARRLF